MKKINFFDGSESSTEPVIGTITATHLAPYPNDAAYEAVNGPGVAGSYYYNTTTNVKRYYDAGEAAWKDDVEKPIDAADIADGSVSNAEFQQLDGVTSPIQDQLDAKIDESREGQPDGIATLDGTGKVPAAQLPSFVDDVLEYADLASFPVSGETGKIYVAIDTGKTYRWSGSMYIEISAAPVTSVNGEVGAVMLQLDDITDVAAPTPLNREVLRFNGTDWINFNLNQTASDAATGSNATLSSVGEYSVVRLTDSGLVSVEMIPAGYSGQKLVIINRTGDDVDFLNDVGATAADRILTGTSDDLTLANDAAIWLDYDATTMRWQVIGGSGGNSLSGYQETPGGSANGINTTFGPLTYAPVNEDSIIVFLNGVEVDKDDWSLSGSDIVFSDAPATGQEPYVFYLTGGTVTLPSFSNIFKTEHRIISAGEDSAKELTLAHTPMAAGETALDVIGIGPQFNGTDFSVSGSTLSWNALGLDGILSVGDKIRIMYVY